MPLPTNNEEYSFDDNDVQEAQVVVEPQEPPRPYNPLNPFARMTPYRGRKYNEDNNTKTNKNKKQQQQQKTSCLQHVPKQDVLYKRVAHPGQT